MQTFVSRLALTVASLLSLTLTVGVSAQSADTSTFASSGLGAYPPNIGYGTGGPMMMLTASRDHTLFAPIYTDYEDIDGDGVDDYTFKPTFRYYGYFDASKCYKYNASHSTGGRFEPVSLATDADDGAAVRYSCASSSTGRWSGNFLNWATMTRLDVVRKTLYGGFRREDTLQDTTLEMAQVSQDAHSFVKYYSGADIGDYTPYDASADLGGAGLTLCSRGSEHRNPDLATVYPLIRVAKGNYSLWGTTPFTVCNWREEQDNFSFGAKITAFYNKYGPNQNKNVADPTAHRSKLPLRTENAGKKDTSNAELAVRVQVCKEDLIGAERCRVYRDPAVANAPAVFKPIGLLQEFGTTQQARQPARAEFGLITGSYDQNLRGGALRKNVGSLNDEVDFASGRFCHKLAGQGTMPSNCNTNSSGQVRPGIIQSFDSIRLFDQGEFNNTAPADNDFALPKEIVNGNFASWGNPVSEMVVQALSYFAGQNLGTESVGAWPRDSSVGLPVAVSRADPLDDSVVDRVAQTTRRSLYGRAICRPMHMLAISSGSVSYDTNEPGSADDVYDVASGFVGVNGGADNLAALTNRVGVLEKIQGTRRSVGSASGGFGDDCTSKVIGEAIGEVVTKGLADVAGVCPEAPGVKGSYLGAGAAFVANTKAIRELGGGNVASGLTPNTGGSVATNQLPPHALRVKSYAASLAGGVARIEVPIPGAGNRKVYITPESSWDFSGSGFGKTGAALMPGAMLTFKALYATSTSGAYVVTWNDAQFGGDYDMDLVGFIRWELKPSAANPNRHELTVFTDILGQEAGAPGAHGFSIIGTLPNPGSSYFQDGRYLTHGGVNYSAAGSDCAALADDPVQFALRCSYDENGMSSNDGRDEYAWPSSINGGSANVVFIDQVIAGTTYTTTAAKTFLVEGGASEVTLRDPLWYIAKYGGFDTGEKAFAARSTALPTDPTAAGSTSLPTSSNWDRLNNGGQACPNGQCPDGEPDGYFLARRPELLEERLRSLLERITQGSNSAPAVSSAQLVTDSLKYTAEFSQDSFGGALRAYRLDSKGEFLKDEAWNASLKLALGPRRVITNNAQAGMVFDVAALRAQDAAAYRSALAAVPAGTTLTTAQQAEVDARVDELVNYMRGNTTKEGKLFRVRVNGVLGPIVNSTPWLQGRLSGALFNDAFFPEGTPSYRQHLLTKAATNSLLWVGANDGMLHGFNAETGVPVLSYVPSPLAGRLSSALSVTNTSAVSLMDGSPYTGDVLVGAGEDQRWATYLFASLGRGGKAVFALDVTTPAELTEANAAEVFRWMFTASDDADLGYQLQDVVRHPTSGQASPIAYLNNGQFGLLVPNGYRPSTGRPALFILPVSGPVTLSSTAGGKSWKDASGNPVYRKLVPLTADTDNGLMGATWVDIDNNGTADVVYATDLKGRVWKFDIRSSNPQEWGSALVSRTTTTAQNGDSQVVEQAIPLFTALDADNQPLPITTPPAVFFPNFGGTMIGFGTGRSIEGADFPDTSTVQRFFAVWDKGRYAGDRVNPPIEAAAGVTAVLNELPSLQATRTRNGASVPTFIKRVLRRDPTTREVYLIQTETDGTPVTKDGQEVRVDASDLTQRFDTTVNDGWFMAFPAAGESVIFPPARRLNFVLFTTVRPLSESEGEQACSLAPEATLYAFNPINGLPIKSLFYDSSSNMGLKISDQKVIAVGNTVGGSQGVGSPGSTCVAGTKHCKCDAAGKCTIEPPPPCTPSKVVANGDAPDLCSSASNLRIQWREIPGMRTRGADAAEPEPEAPVGGEK